MPPGRSLVYGPRTLVLTPKLPVGTPVFSSAGGGVPPVAVLGVTETRADDEQD